MNASSDASTIPDGDTTGIRLNPECRNEPELPSGCPEGCGYSTGCSRWSSLNSRARDATVAGHDASSPAPALTPAEPVGGVRIGVERIADVWRVTAPAIDIRDLGIQLDVRDSVLLGYDSLMTTGRARATIRRRTRLRDVLSHCAFTPRGTSTIRRITPFVSSIAFLAVAECNSGGSDTTQ